MHARTVKKQQYHLRTQSDVESQRHDRQKPSLFDQFQIENERHSNLFCDYQNKLKQQFPNESTSSIDYRLRKLWHVKNLDGSAVRDTITTKQSDILKDLKNKHY